MIDISNPVVPFIAGSSPVSPTPDTNHLTIDRVSISGSFAYLAKREWNNSGFWRSPYFNYTSGMSIVNISNPFSPMEIGSWHDLSYPEHNNQADIYVTDNFIYLADGFANKIRIFPTNTPVEEYTFSTKSNGIFVVGNHVCSINDLTFSIFGINGFQPEASNSLLVYPNPSKPLNLFVTFIGLSTYNKLKIYTINGELIREITPETPLKTLYWDKRNQSGEEVASGVYVYSAIDSNGGTKTGKLAIVR